MSTLAAWWIFAVLLVVLTFYQAIEVFIARRHRRRNAPQERLRQVETRVVNSQLLAQYGKSLATVLSSVPNPQSDTDVLVAIANASSSEYLTLKADAEALVNLLNDEVGAAIDSGKVRVRDIARNRPELHETCLRASVLLRPFVLHEAILTFRGRWGYRMLFLAELLDELRAISKRETLHGEVTVAIGQTTVRRLPAIALPRRALLHVRFVVSAPRNTTRRKVAQNEQIDEIRTSLLARGTVAMPQARMW